VDQGSGVVSLFGRASGEDNPPDSGDRALPTRKVKSKIEEVFSAPHATEGENMINSSGIKDHPVVSQEV
jgi:hypothetical protein